MRVDCHTHIGPGSDGMDRPPEQLVAMMDDLEIDKALVFPGVLGLRGSPSQAARANDFTAQAMARWPQRFAGFAAVNPWHGDEGLAELERAVKQLGLKGLKLHPPSQGFDVADFELMTPLMDLVTELRIPVAIHCGLRVHDNSWRVGVLAEAYPRTVIFMLHSNFGGHDRVGAQWVAKRAKNVLFETSATMEPAFIAEIMRLTGGRQVVYGSDWPWIPARMGLAIVQAAGLSEADTTSVLGNNVARVLGL